MRVNSKTATSSTPSSSPRRRVLQFPPGLRANAARPEDQRQGTAARLMKRGSRIEDRGSRIEDRAIKATSILDPRSSILALACLLQLFRMVLLLEALQVIDKARRRAFRYLFQIALQQLLALLFDVAADFAAEVPDHPELFGRQHVAQRLGSRVARDARRYPVVLFGDVGLAAVKVAGDAEFNGGAFQRVVLGLLDAGLGVGGAVAF